jgi:diguanylate cyclase (GGDEF)-like protein
VLQGHFDVETAVDGELALASALADPPDVVLTDVMMPRLDGFGLLAALRRDDRTRTIPVIMLSARAGEEASFDGIRAGVDDYLAKPFSAQELVARVTRCLANAELRREAEQRLAMTNGKLHQALRELEAIARTDALTGLPNRRTWDLELPVTLARAKRGDHAVCVAVLDIDRFKTFNDTFGHLAGDVLLRDAGAAWQDALRDTDVIARLGGDEFGVLLPGCPLDLAESVLRRACAAMPHDATCSSGVACWDGAETAEQLVARADSALYVAKQRRHGTTIVAS